MAEREVVFTTKVDASDSVEELETIKGLLEDIEDDIRNVDKASAEGTAAKNFDKLNKVIDENVLSLQELGTAADNFKNIALAAGKESPVGKQALQRAADMEKEINQLTRDVDALAEGGRGLQNALQLETAATAGFTAFQGAVALTGVENEKLEETFVKLQAAQSLLAGIQELKIALDKQGVLVTQAQTVATKAQELITGKLTFRMIALNVANKLYTGATKAATIATRIFNTVVKANPLGLLIVGITLLIGLFVAFGDSIGSIGDALSGFVQSVAKSLGFIEKTEADLEAERLARQSEVNKRHAAIINNIKEERAERKKQREDENSAFDLRIAQLEAEGKSSFSLRLAKAQNTKADLEDQLETIRILSEQWTKYYEDQFALSGKSREDFIQNLKDQGIDIDLLSDQRIELQEKIEREVAFSEVEITKIKFNENKKRAAEADKAAQADIAREQKRLAELQKLLDEQVKANEKAGEQLFNSRQKLLDRVQKFELAQQFDSFQLRMDALRTQHGIELELIGENNELRLQLEREFRENMALIQEEADLADNESRQVEIDARNEQINQGLETAQAALDAAVAINEILEEIGSRRIAKIQAERDGDLKHLESNKKAVLAQEGLSAKKRAQIEFQFALAEFKIKKDAAEAEDKIARKAFQRNKALKIVEIAINTAASVMQALGGFPPPASFIFAGINATVGTVQAALVAAQKFKGSASSITPPTFSPPSIGDAAGGGGGDSGAASGGGALQDDIITDLDALGDQESMVTVSQVEINENQDQMAEVSEVATL